MHLSKRARVLTRAALLSLLSVWLLQAVPAALAWSSPQKLLDIPYNVYRPKIAGEGNRFHVVFEQADDKVLYYSRGTSTNGRVTWEEPRKIASNVNTQQDWDIIADETGTLHVAYSTSGRQMLYLQNTSRGDAGSWSSPELVMNLPGRVNLLNITLDAARVPYIAWGSAIDPSTLLFAYRDGGGWSVRDAQLGNNVVRNPHIVVAGSGDAAMVHIVYEDKRRSADKYYTIGYTRGTRTGTLSNRNFSAGFGDGGENGLPNIALDTSDGTLYAVYVGGKHIKEYPLKFTYSTNGGQSWAPVAKESLGTDLWVTGQKAVPPLFAANGVVSLLIPVKQWDGDGYASSGLYATDYTRSTRQFSKPTAILDVRRTDRRNNDADLAVNQVARTTVWISGYIENIYFSTDTSNVPPSQPDGQLVLNGGTALATSTSVPIEIRNATGSPTQMRVAIDTPLSDAIPLEPFQASFTRTIPASSQCEHTVAVQLVNDQGLVSQSTTLAGKITVDTAVQASVAVRNPYERGNAVLPSSAQNSNQVVTDGDPAYTREQQFYLEVNGSGECSSLSQVQVGADAATLGAPASISSNILGVDQPLPGTAQVGPNQVAVRVQDSLGNTQDYARTIIYDPLPPTLATTGTLEVRAPASGPTILATLVFSGNQVADNLYPAPGFWGVWVANSRTPITNPISNTALIWSPVHVAATSGSFTLPNWSLLTGIAPTDRTPGTYYVYTRFLDGAGNPTTGVLSGTVQLNQIVEPSVSLPVVVK